MFEIAEARAAKLLLDGNSVQAQRAEPGPEIPWKLVTSIDLGGARRDFIHREIMDGLPQRVRGFAEIEIEIPIRVGNHGGRPPCREFAGFCAQPYSLPISLSRGARPEKRHSGCRWRPPDCRDASKLALALARARGCNSTDGSPFGREPRRGLQGVADPGASIAFVRQSPQVAARECEGCASYHVPGIDRP